jgi:DNA-binding transcriptional MerR regulator
MYTVKQLAELAGVSVRTLHYYDEIELLQPSQVGSNGYRYYDEAAVLRLQQILFYRELEVELIQIKTILDDPEFDLVAALRQHRAALAAKATRLAQLTTTIDRTIQHLTGDRTMSSKQLFEGFSAEQQKEYEREARLQYGADNVNESAKRWQNYSKGEQQAIMDEGNGIYRDIIAAIEAHLPIYDERVQTLMTRWHEHLRYFYEPTLEILRGLGHLYNDDERFLANFRQMHVELAPYMRDAIEHYVDALETAAIERLLAEDAEQQGQD